jgi:hypothetical protein
MAEYSEKVHLVRSPFIARLRLEHAGGSLGRHSEFVRERLGLKAAWLDSSD